MLLGLISACSVYSRTKKTMASYTVARHTQIIHSSHIINETQLGPFDLLTYLLTYTPV